MRRGTPPLLGPRFSMPHGNFTFLRGVFPCGMETLPFPRQTFPCRMEALLWGEKSLHAAKTLYFCQRSHFLPQEIVSFANFAIPCRKNGPFLHILYFHAARIHFSSQFSHSMPHGSFPPSAQAKRRSRQHFPPFRRKDSSYICIFAPVSFCIQDGRERKKAT